MQRPPFRLASTDNADGRDQLHPLVDLCCAQPTQEVRGTLSRSRLGDLDPLFHCSIIGTCLTTAELRRLVPRFAELDREDASDLEIHHAAVHLAAAGGAGAKALHKALESRYETTLKRYHSVSTDTALGELWQQALKNGEVPAAYWALMTHPRCSQALRELAFGDVHMLSHLVGASNRAELRRLVALEQENVELKDQLERQQSRLNEMGTAQAAATRQFEQQLGGLKAQLERSAAAHDAEAGDKLAKLRDALAARDELLALHTARRDTAEQRSLQERQATQALQVQLEQALALLDATQAEAGALERTLERSLAGGPSASTTVSTFLRERRIVYVGGRPGTHAMLKSLVDAAGGALTIHDGGIEDRKGLLGAALAHADLVIFPVDCVDHDSAATLKRVCARHQIPYYPVRTASIAAFMELIGRLEAAAARPQSEPAQHPPPSHFCLRHG